MSLTVHPDLLMRAQQGPVTDAEFVECIRTSLPYAWSVVADVADKLAAQGGAFADNQTPPPDEDARGELLRLVASDAMRSAVERHFGVRVAFQNCHRLAMFDPTARELYEEFVTPRSQLLNQRPEFINC
ncbi:MAG TPA: SCO5389 family protein [Pseudonocardiaceae bacterium]